MCKLDSNGIGIAYDVRGSTSLLWKLHMDELIQKLKIQIVESLQIDDLSPEDIADDQPLVGGPHGIDSIDVLELVMMVEKNYGVIIDSKAAGQKAFASVAALAEFIRSKTGRE